MAAANDWGMIFAVLAVISMIVGNVAAIPQTNIKRMLGYSSIAQAGYLMVGLAAIGVFTHVVRVSKRSAGAAACSSSWPATL